MNSEEDSPLVFGIVAVTNSGNGILFNDNLPPHAA